MSKYIFLISFSISTFLVQGQNYSNYYNLCNTADSLEYVGLNQEALEAFKVAFESVSYIHSEKYHDAYQLAIKMEEYQDAFQFGKMTIINSGLKNLIATRSAKFKRSEYFKLLNDSTEYYLNFYKSRVNHDYINIIDSLHFIDQNIIRKNRSVKGNYKIVKDSLPKNLYELDNSNWQYLHMLIDSLGFPSEQNVGLKACKDAWIIIHHNLRLKENEIYHKEIFDYIRQGKYLPVHFSYWYEQFQTWNNGQSFFFTWDQNTTVDNLERINANRRLFYLKSSNSFNLKNNGRKWRKKW